MSKRIAVEESGTWVVGNNRGLSPIITINKADQTITGFAPATPIVYSIGASFMLTATGGASANPVTFASTTPLVCSVSGNLASILAAGPCTLTANQAGNVTFNAAPQVTVTVTISKADQTITGFTPASPVTLAVGGTFTLSATGGASGKPVTFSTTTTTICTTAGTNNATVTVIAAGTCALTANQAGDGVYNAATPVTANVAITVQAAEATIYYVHADHLGTPRAITRPSDNAVVWKWENSDPFGANLPNENPSGLGAFAFNLRFPGQYYDQEMGTHYNYFRDYDPSIGRYIQSDPIGLFGGINTFGYVKASPLKFVDPEGLKVQQCCRKAEILGGLVDHCWLKTDTITAGMASNPVCRAGVGDTYEPLYITKVYISDASCEKGDCVDIPWEVDEACVNRELKIGKALGTFGPLNSCQTFANTVLNKCTKVKPPPKKPAPSGECCKK